MTLLLCKLWPYLAGGLVGWLLAGWLSRWLKYGEPPVRKEIIVEKKIDNPDHLSLISQLKAENATIENLKAEISRLENTRPKVVEKIVEKFIDNPEHLSLISRLKTENKTIGDLKTRINHFESAEPKIIEKTVEVEKRVDNPEHLQRIRFLETENIKINHLKATVKSLAQGPDIDVKAARAAGLSIKNENDFSVIEGIGPKINSLIHEAGIHSFRELSQTDPSNIQKVLDEAGPNFRLANPGTWPDQAYLAANNRWSALKALQNILDGGVYPDGSASAGKAKSVTSGNAPHLTDQIIRLKKELKAYQRGPEIDMEKARAAGFHISRKDNSEDFTVIEGIGPGISKLLHNAGIHTYQSLADTKISHIQKILDAAGPSFRLARPDTWPDQSNLAASNQWAALKAWQDILDGGEK